MSIIVVRKTVVTLSEFLESHNLALIVRETGSSKWEASFDPEVLEDSDEGISDEDTEAEMTPVVIEGTSEHEAVQLMCGFLSGRDGLCIDDELGPVDLDLYYTKVECDPVAVVLADDEETENVDPDAGNLMRATMRHHGSE